MIRIYALNLSSNFASGIGLASGNINSLISQIAVSSNFQTIYINSLIIVNKGSCYNALGSRNLVVNGVLIIYSCSTEAFTFAK